MHEMTRKRKAKKKWEETKRQENHKIQEEEARKGKEEKCHTSRP